VRLRKRGKVDLMSLRKNLSRRLSSLGIFIELWHFLRIRKKWWLAPIIIMLLLLGVLLFATSGTPLAAILYTFF